MRTIESRISSIHWKLAIVKDTARRAIENGNSLKTGVDGASDARLSEAIMDYAREVRLLERVERERK